MTHNDKPVEIETVKCEVCLKEVPLSEATVPEASGYFVNFFGLECDEKWKAPGNTSRLVGRNPGA